ncbi:MAG: UbiA family prenyltransferase [Planctomycetota bacterium]
MRALLEALRAPLLLSPVADVLVGWCVAAGALTTGARAHDGLGVLLRTALAGCCLLAAGMAQNALVDLDEDRRRRPGRPLPRGDVSTRSVAAVWILATLAGMALAATVAVELAAVAGLIVLVTLAYHAGLKRVRLPGCILLGSARGMDLLLGAVAHAIFATGGLSLPAEVWAAALVYALYMVGASLHASTDDEPDSGAWSRAGLALSFAMLGALALAAGGSWRGVGAAPAAGLLVAVWSIARLARAATRLPAPALTGVALSNLHLVDAAVCLIAAPAALAAPSAVVVLALFWFSRRLLTVFPPT